jgi:hypothetical protein
VLFASHHHADDEKYYIVGSKIADALERLQYAK